MLVQKTSDFLRELEGLPIGIKNIFEKQESVFKENWLDGRLHTKRLKDLAGAYSFRVTRRYRAIFYLRGNEAIFFSIGHRKDIYR
ncbi:MAG: hypothetical protein HY434_01940 [Candidatus Liptonbacteria bacterium]|nr:hypothetical protein [Candidatus Liptonbacteria bacterium]